MCEISMPGQYSCVVVLASHYLQPVERRMCTPKEAIVLSAPNSSRLLRCSNFSCPESFFWISLFIAFAYTSIATNEISFFAAPLVLEPIRFNTMNILFFLTSAKVSSSAWARFKTFGCSGDPKPALCFLLPAEGRPKPFLDTLSVDEDRSFTVFFLENVFFRQK